MNKFLKISIVAGAVLGVVSPFLAGATSIITLPYASSTDLLAFAGTLFTDLWMLIALAIGIPLGFYIIKGAISLIRSRHKA